MKIYLLEEQASLGNIILHKYGREHVRNKYVYKASKPTKKESDEDYLDDDFFKLDKIVKQKYMRYFYFARTKDMPEYKNYKITGKDYKVFLSLGARED